MATAEAGVRAGSVFIRKPVAAPVKLVTEELPRLEPVCVGSKDWIGTGLEHVYFPLLACHSADGHAVGEKHQLCGIGGKTQSHFAMA